MNRLEARGICKSFGGVKAVDHISLDLRAGEIHSIIGENGAGKSTFIRMIAGDHVPDEGEMYFNGEKVDVFSPQEMERRGVRTIYQEFNLVGSLSIAENIFLGKPVKGKSGRFVDWKEMNRQASVLLDRMGFDFDPATPVGELTVAEHQIVEILKAMSRKADLLIMDEPTAALNDEEKRKLFALVRQLASEGVTILYISHYLEEVVDLSDRITVFRDGRKVCTAEKGERSIPELVNLMIGRELGQMYPKETVPIGEEILRAEDLCSDELKDVSFSLRRGEVLGVYGLLGAGQHQVCNSLFGDHKLTQGKIYVKGRQVQIRKPIDGSRAGIGLVPIDRKNEALFMNMDVGNNLTISGTPTRAKWGIINSRKEHQIVDDFIHSLNIKTTGYSQMVSNLSGGNQQKVVIARWLDANSDVLVLCDPTRGVDVGAKVEIYRMITACCREGKAVLMMSSDLPELLGVTDRVLLMREGRIVAEKNAGETNQEEVLNIVNGEG